MSDHTATAKALVATTARAFYDDDAVCVVAYLLRNDFLRDGRGMGPKHFSLTTKQVRRVLTFLQDEHIVSAENVTGRVETTDAHRTYRRKKTVKFWFIDLNRAAHSIRLRVHLMVHRLQARAEEARSTSTYVCPGYGPGRCNGRYEEIEVQSFPVEGGMFLCHECALVHRNNPDPPLKSSYTLELVDTEEDLRDIEECLARVNAQMSSKTIGGERLRPGIFDLLGAVRACSKRERLPVTSNLPSENGAADCLGNDREREDDTPFAQKFVDEMHSLVYVPNSMGQDQIALEIERGAGAQAIYWSGRGRTVSSEERRVMIAATRVGMASSGLERGTVAPSSLRACDRKGGERLPDRPRTSVCPQTMPFFLENNLGSLPALESGLGLEGSVRQMSIESNQSYQTFSDASGKSAVPDETIHLDGEHSSDISSEKSRRKAFLDEFRSQKSFQEALLESRVPTGKAKWEGKKEGKQSQTRDISGSSQGSIEWEEG